MTEEMQLLQDAVFEIKTLRNQNQEMKLRLAMFDSCMLLLTANIQRSGEGYAPDVVAAIEKFIDSKN